MRTLSRPVIVTAALGLTLAVVGCTGAEPDARPDVAGSASGSATSSAMPSPSPTATSSPESAVQPGAPYDAAEARTWIAGVADSMTQLVGADAVMQGTAGHLDAETSQNRRDTDLTLAAGDYSFHLACRGTGGLSLQVTSGGVTSPIVDADCSSTGFVSGDFTAVDGGTDFRFVATGAPVDYLLRYGSRLPAAGS